VTDHLDRPTRDAIRRVLANPIFELIPLKNVIADASHLPQGATVSVTASPAKGMEATMDLCEELSEMGFDVVPHLSARLTEDRQELETILERSRSLQMTRAFVVGGDAADPGEFLDGYSLLSAMQEIGHPFSEIGIPSYPEGHAEIPDDALDQALLDKQPFADSMTTQMCFSGEAIEGWAKRQRAAGVTLPLILGMPGVADRMRLLKISARIGVGDSLRFLRKNTGAAAKFVMPGGYNPAELLEEVGSTLDDPEMDVTGVHVYTFNSCEATEEWRLGYLEELE